MRATAPLSRAMVMLLAVALTGCGLRPDARPRILRADEAPAGLRNSASPTTSGTARVLVYLVLDGTLVAVSRAVPPHPTAATALRALLAGPTARDQEAGLLSAAPAATLSGPVRGGVATVDVPSVGASSGGRTDEVTGLAQIVLTLTSLRGVTSVAFSRDGKPLSVPRADGSLAPGPVSRKDYVALL